MKERERFELCNLGLGRYAAYDRIEEKYVSEETHNWQYVYDLCAKLNAEEEKKHGG